MELVLWTAGIVLCLQGFLGIELVLNLDRRGAAVIGLVLFFMEGRSPYNNYNPHDSYAHSGFDDMLVAAFAVHELHNREFRKSSGSTKNLVVFL